MNRKNGVKSIFSINFRQSIFKIMDLNINKRKFEIFVEVAKGLNESFAVIPVLFGSLGLYRQIGEFGKVNDIDILVPDSIIKERWQELVSFMERLGFKLINEKEHEFMRNNEIVAFGKESDLSVLDKIDTNNLLITKVNGIKFKELSAGQFLLCYQNLLRDNYRQEKLGKNDKEKIELIKNYLSKIKK